MTQVLPAASCDWTSWPAGPVAKLMESLYASGVPRRETTRLTGREVVCGLPGWLVLSSRGAGASSSVPIIEVRRETTREIGREGLLDAIGSGARGGLGSGDGLREAAG